MVRARGIAVTAAALSLVMGSVAAPVGAATPAASLRMIVLLRAPATHGVRATAAAERPAVAATTAAGGHVRHRYSLIDGFATSMSPAAARALARRPDVAAVVPDRLIRIARPTRPNPSSVGRFDHASATTPVGHRAVGTAQPDTRDAPATQQQLPALDPTVCPADPAHPLTEPEGLSTIRAHSDEPGVPSAADYADGTGVKVGVIADGIDPGNADFQRDGRSVVTDYRDFAGTGTDVPADQLEGMGDIATIAAQGNTTWDLSALGPRPAGCTIRVRGVAPGADVVALKILDGDSFYSSVVVALVPSKQNVGNNREN